MARFQQRIFLPFILLSAAVFAFSQEPDPDLNYYGLDHWGQADGLPQTTVRAIYQTRDGYIWLGTSGGLLRFDGNQFVRFSVQTGSLRDNEVRSITEDSDNGVWVGTYGGGVTVYRNGRFKTYTTADGLPDNVVRKVCRDSEGNIWAATQKGLCRFSGGTLFPFTAKEGMPTEAILDLSITNSNLLYVITQSGLYRLNGDRFEPVPGVLEPRDGGFQLIGSGMDRSVWIVFESGVVKRHKDGSTISYLSWAGKISGISAIYEDPQGTFWIGGSQGIWRWKNERLDPILTKTTAPWFRAIRSICMDHEGSLWVGTGADGLARLRRNQLLTMTVADGLPNENVRVMIEDRHRTLWIGTAGGLARYQDGQLTEISKDQGVHLIVSSLAEDKNGSILIGSRGALLRLRDGRMEAYPGWKESKSAIRVILRDKNDILWIGTEADGLYRAAGEETTSFQREEGLPSNAIRGLFSDHQGGLWVATFGGGVCRYFQGSYRKFPETEALGVKHALDFHEEEGGTLWIATRGGLLRFKNGRFSLLTEKNGLASSYTFRILDDERGSFWFSSSMGIFSARKKELDDCAEGITRNVTVTAYGVKDGMQTDVCTLAGQPSGFRTADGRLLFGTLKGLVTIDFNHLFTNRLPPPVAIEEVTINRQKLNTHQPAVISPGAGEFEIRYAGLSYLAPEKVLFQHKLEGADEDWVDAGTRRFAYYSHLPPGNYIFHVIACNNNGIWNREGASFSFYLKPYFYQTTWFFFCCAFGAVGLASCGVGLRIHRITLQRRRLESLVSERTQQLQEALQKVEDLANTDGLTGVANRRCFENWLAREWRRSLRDLRDMSVIMIDVDYFKLYNDHYGHQEGDECLKRVAETIRSNGLRASDLAGRYGGEEFILILPATSLVGAAFLAEKIRTAVEELHIRHGLSPISDFVTISVGVASVVPTQGNDYRNLIAGADNQLYRAKGEGRNRVCAA